MNKYLLLMRGSWGTWNRRPEDERAALVAEFGSYAAMLAEKGALVAGEECQARSVRLRTPTQTIAQSLVPDSADDAATGYFVIQVNGEQEALALARQCPAFKHGEWVEVIPCG